MNMNNETSNEIGFDHKFGENRNQQSNHMQDYSGFFEFCFTVNRYRSENFNQIATQRQNS